MIFFFFSKVDILAQRIKSLLSIANRFLQQKCIQLTSQPLNSVTFPISDSTGSKYLIIVGLPYRISYRGEAELIIWCKFLALFVLILITHINRSAFLLLCKSFVDLGTVFCSLDPINSGYASKIKFVHKENREPDYSSRYSPLKL